MSYEPFPFTVAWRYFVRTVRNFANSEAGGRARWMFVGLIAFMFAINGMTVVNSYVGRDFMTAIADRDRTGFIHQAVLYVIVFAVSTLISVNIRFLEERLALRWREYLTRRMLDHYLADGSYYQLDASRTLANPDQRIAEDARSFTVTTLSFVLMILNSSFTIVAFSGVLWTISPTLFMVAVLYAAGGSLLTVLLGRPLVGLNYEQFDREANFRSGLIHVRENAEAILLAGGEERLSQRLHGSFSSLVSNFRRMISINRNLGFFTTGYNWLIQIIPALIIAPAFIDGRVEFGVVTQSAMAFSTLVAAFSLIVTQFQSISTFAAVVTRLSLLMEAVDASKHCAQCTIEFCEEEGRLAFEELTLRSSNGGGVERVLLDESVARYPARRTVPDPVRGRGCHTGSAQGGRRHRGQRGRAPGAAGRPPPALAARAALPAAGHPARGSCRRRHGSPGVRPEDYRGARAVGAGRYSRAHERTPHGAGLGERAVAR